MKEEMVTNNDVSINGTKVDKYFRGILRESYHSDEPAIEQNYVVWKANFLKEIIRNSDN